MLYQTPIWHIGFLFSISAFYLVSENPTCVIRMLIIIMNICTVEMIGTHTKMAYCPVWPLIVKSKDLREEFILDTVSLCTHADIPLHKAEKMRPFLQKYCKQAGSLPQLSTLRMVYVPRLFELHYAALAERQKKINQLTL